MKSQSRETHIMLLNQHLKTATEGKTPGDYVGRLSTAKNLPIRELKETLESVRVALTNNPVSWIIQFGARGLNLLINHLHMLNKELVDHSIKRCDMGHPFPNCFF